VEVLVATDGNLNPDRVARFAAPLAGADGTVTVLTVVEIPRRLISELRTAFGERAPSRVEADGEYVGITTDSGDPPRSWPGDQAMVDRYLADKEADWCEPIAAALRADGVNAVTKAVEGEHAAKAIVRECSTSNADVIVVGSHGEGRFEGMLGSTGSRLARLSKCPVLLLRGNPAD
jgi:nucleotide-binding universal stress UspA family protein